MVQKWPWKPVRFGAMLASTMRQFQRSPGFTMTAILTLAVGIAAMVAMFSTYSRAVLNPVTLSEPETLISIYSANYKTSFVPPTLSWPRFESLRGGTSVFSQLGAYSPDSVNLSGMGDTPPEQLRALRISGNFLGAIRVVPFRGRLFTPEDDARNGPAVCILSWELAQSRFGGPGAVGSNIQLNGKPTEVVGVVGPMSPPWSDRQIFLPRVFEDSGIPPQSIATGATYLEVVGRLRPGTAVRDAETQVRAVSRDYSSRFQGRSDAANELQVRPFLETVVGKRRGVFVALLGAVVLVLLVSCANTSALFLSRLASREREIAVRQALGAGRTRIVAGLLRESLELALAAGALGIAVAELMLRVAQATFSAELPAGLNLEMSSGAAGVAIVTVLLCAVLVGLIPALHVTRRSTSSPLLAFARGASEGAAARRFRAILVIVEVALSVFLLIGAGLLIASLNRLQRTSPGFEPAGVAAAFANLPAERYATPERQAAFFLDVIERLRNQPQVTGAAVVFGLPFHDDNFASTYAISGRPIPPPPERARAGLRMVSEDYFQVMRMRILAGRRFAITDRAGAPGVCIVNESLARRQFPGRSPLGQVIRRGREADQRFEIVGIVADVKTNGLRSATPDEIFYPFRQLQRANAAIVARTNGDPARLRPIFESTVSAVDSEQPLSRFAPMEERLAGTLGGERALASLTGAFAFLALALASVGLYAVLAQNVAARTVEIGIRLAIGAEPVAVVRLVLRQGMRLAVIGIAAGLISAVVAARILAAQLFEVSPRDPLVYVSVSAIFGAVATLASLAPALRASRVDPLILTSAR